MIKQIEENFAIGRVYKTFNAENTCPDCDFKTYNNTYVRLEDGESLQYLADRQDNFGISVIRVSICECGNIFLRMREELWK